MLWKKTEGFWKTGVLKILLFLFICMLGVGGSIREIMLDAFIKGGVGHGAAVSMMDAVAEEYPEASMEQLEEIQTGFEQNRALRKMTGKYMDLAVKVAVDGQNFASDGMEEEIASMADEAAAQVAGVMKEAPNEELKQKLKREGDGINQAVLDYAQAAVGGFGSGSEKMRPFVAAYKLLASPLCMAVGIAGIFLIIAALFLQKHSLLSVIGICKIPVLLSGLCLGILAPAILYAAGRVVSNRYLGRTMIIDTAPLRMTGFIILFIGAVFLIISARFPFGIKSPE